MEFVRWYFWPVAIGFIVCLIMNPVATGVGIFVWLALVYYLFKRWTGTAEY